MSHRGQNNRCRRNRYKEAVFDDNDVTMDMGTITIIAMAFDNVKLSKYKILIIIIIDITRHVPTLL